MRIYLLCLHASLCVGGLIRGYQAEAVKDDKATGVLGSCKALSAGGIASVRDASWEYLWLRYPHLIMFCKVKKISSSLGACIIP
jgi:hypothetical protein